MLTPRTLAPDAVDDQIQRRARSTDAGQPRATVPVGTWPTDPRTSERPGHEKLPGVNEGAIEEHEEMAKISMIIIAVTGVVALIGLLARKNKSIGKFVFLAAAVLSLASFGTMAQTAHLGGLIRHTELQNGAATSEKENEEKEDDDNKAQQKEVKDSLKQAERTIKKADDDD